MFAQVSINCCTYFPILQAKSKEMKGARDFCTVLHLCNAWSNHKKQIFLTALNKSNLHRRCKHSHSPSPSFSDFMNGLRFFSNKTALSVYSLLSSFHVASSRVICTFVCKQIFNICKKTWTAFYIQQSQSSVINTPPEASPEPSSQLRKSTSCGCALSGPEPIRLLCVKQMLSVPPSLCSPGYPLRLPVLLDDA